jgi:hypothetical protein
MSKNTRKFSCSTCDAYNPVNEYGGNCRLKTPTVIVVPRSDSLSPDIMTVWPWVHPDEWCQEHIKKSPVFTELVEAKKDV